MLGVSTGAVLGGVDREEAQGSLLGAVTVLYLDLGCVRGGGSFGKHESSCSFQMCALYTHSRLIIEVYKNFIALLLFSKHEITVTLVVLVSVCF